MTSLHRRHKLAGAFSAPPHILARAHVPYVPIPEVPSASFVTAMGMSPAPTPPAPSRRGGRSSRLHAAPPALQLLLVALAAAASLPSASGSAAGAAAADAARSSSHLSSAASVFPTYYRRALLQPTCAFSCASLPTCISVSAGTGGG